MEKRTYTEMRGPTTEDERRVSRFVSIDNRWYLLLRFREKVSHPPYTVSADHIL